MRVLTIFYLFDFIYLISMVMDVDGDTMDIKMFSDPVNQLHINHGLWRTYIIGKLHGGKVYVRQILWFVISGM